MQNNTEKKFNRLKRIITSARKAVVAFSGGVDSTFLLAVCVDRLKDQVLAVTVNSEFLPQNELGRARELARRLGASHLVVDSKDLEVDGLAANPPDRCYLCKKERFLKIVRIAGKNTLNCVFDGSNTDDTKDFRPGLKAVRELGIRSPLIEAKLNKAEIRCLSKALNLTTWDQPSASCLATRIPYGTQITPRALKQIDSAETFLRQQGMRVFRVRHHGNIARLELGESEMRHLFENDLYHRVVRRLKTAGYQYVTLDLEGYRSGSMNDILPEPVRKKANIEDGFI
ncbi:MAG: ATP-dependent sacrificial sulfur transferase LarE [Deltaproteobacteria bacterium]|nr:MAG: ATP-dependent sacrificial sulfur transferase LarE [Deltaproteobacteria bacterium]